ncbi:hypothetical protein BGZ75_006885 [Mortierella antarctica]|nr:hypothetical protein BGZ75_006885 [Mortierella antarctica]
MTLLAERRDIQHPEITISGLGMVKGALDEAHPVVKFLNVPFGVVSERWRPAAKAGPWQGVRDGTKNGFSPPQGTAADPLMSTIFGMKSNMVYEEAMSERDCLSLNIYMPASALDSDEKLPVCVWLYGGGYKAGSITTPIYDCTQLVSTSIDQKKPMIVVSINYRVNFFGFISSKELALDAQTYAKAVPEDQRQWYDASVGNWGLLDQILGLEWVRDHIRAFKGNPRRVTAMGESVGSMSISHLLLIPQCHGLYHRAVLQSGSASSLPTMPPEIEGQRYFDYLCQIFKVPADIPPLDKVAMLRAVPEKALADVMNITDIRLFRPTLDGVLFKGDSRSTVGDVSLYDPNINWIVIGSCADEGSMFPSTFNATIPKNVAKLKARLCAPGDDAIFDRVFGVPKTDAEATEISARLLGSGLFDFPILQASEAILVHPTCQLTRYHFDVQVHRTNELIPGLKAHHAADVYFTLGNKALLAMLSDEERMFIRKVQEVWIEVVAAKTPEGSHLPKVSNVLPTATPEEAIVFGADLKVGRGVVERMPAEEVEFWRRSFAHAAEQAKFGKGIEVGIDTFNAL